MSEQISETSVPEWFDYKSDLTPVWCPGCGDFTVLTAIVKALAALELAREDVAVVSGIGCSSRIPAYTNLYGYHTIHGRALPVAAGLKVARPDLTVLVAGGDGDGFSIGGNHFVHACRRNVDLTYIVMDNAVYGMTKGQASPTSAADWRGSKLTPEGPGVAPLRPLELALSCGAAFIARGFAGNPNVLAKMIADAIRHPGFSLVQILSPCITYRPEQREYRKMLTNGFAGHDPESPATDRREAFLRLLEDDGFSCGILYSSAAPTYAANDPYEAQSLTAIERQFAL